MYIELFFQIQTKLEYQKVNLVIGWQQEWEEHWGGAQGNFLEWWKWLYPDCDDSYKGM